MARETKSWNEDVIAAQAEAAAAVDKLIRAVVAQKQEWGVWDHLEDKETGAPVNMLEEFEGAYLANFVVGAEYQLFSGGDPDETLFACTGPLVRAATKIGLATMMLDEFTSS